jgi:uroporphyrinogen-III decarboxylase
VPSKPGDQVDVQTDKPLLGVLRGERRDPLPVWMMRQAGRYLPEYRELRADKGGFLDLVYDGDAAAEITLQPLKRFPELDAAILFSDILIVPFAIGQNLTFRAAYADPAAFKAIIERIEAVTLDYLSKQIAAGADAVQLFDSWAGSLSPAQFEQWVIAPTARLVAALHKRHPDVPVIGFPKGAGGKLAAYARETGVAAIGLDETVDPVWAAKELPDGLPVQGNLDPLALIAGGETLRRSVALILDAFAARPHIFNLGHGILQDTPIAHVQDMLARVKGKRGRSR